MNTALAIIFFEDHFVGTILPNESAWEVLTIGETQKPLLYFFVSGGDVRNDDFARERYEAKDGSAFGDFYAIIRDQQQTFRRFDLEIPAIQLLQDVSQKVKAAYSERMRAFDQFIDMEAAIPVHLCFVPGIHPDAQDRLREFFAGDGYALQNPTDYHSAFVKSLQRKAVVPSKGNIAIVEPSFGDMRFHYLECDGAIVKRASEVLIGKGVDFRVGDLAKLLVQKAAKRSSSRILLDPLLLEEEIKRFHKRAAVEINRFEYDQLDVVIELLDFCKARVIVDRRELEQMAAGSLKYIAFRFQSFVSNCSSMMRTEKIVLNGISVGSPEFVKSFEREFGATKVIPPFDNFVELLSRGIFALSDQEIVGSEEQVEIKITVTTKPASGGATATREVRVTPPPLPPRPPAPPPLPPLHGSSSREIRIAGGRSSEGAKVPAPPMPPIHPPMRGNTPVRPPLPPVGRPEKRKEEILPDRVESREESRVSRLPRPSTQTPAPPPLPGKRSTKAVVKPDTPSDPGAQPAPPPALTNQQQPARAPARRKPTKKKKGSGE